MKPIRHALAILAFVATGVAFSADVAALNQQGVQAYNNKDFTKAIELFTEVFKRAPADETAATNLLTAYRSLAAHYANKGDYDNAETTLRKAGALLPQRSALNNDLIIVTVNKATACYNARDYARARQIVAGALQLDASHPVANRLAGDIAYAQHDLAATLLYWNRALAADPKNADLISRIARLQKEQGVENSYSKMEAYKFDIRFDYQTLGNGVCDLRAFLMQAYEKVGQDFDRFPEYPITVILYGENDFRMVNNVPEYVAGLYDGIIRVPVNFARYPLPILKGIIFHEYAHALVHDLAGDACPLWLNEGIAMREMNAHVPVATGALRQALTTGATLPLTRLDDRNGVWRNPNLFPLAYAQSWIMTEYLFDRWSNSQVKRMMQRLKQGGDFTTILSNDMNRTPEQFDEEWKTYAREKHQYR